MSARKVVMKIVSISFSILVLILLAAALYQGGKASYGFGYRVFTEPAVDMPEEGDRKSTRLNSSHWS